MAAPDASAPIACTLDGAELGDRENEFRDLFARALWQVTRHDARSARLALDTSAEAEARDLFAREHHCCAFFDFTVAVEGDTLVIDARVPAHASAALDFLLALAPRELRGKQAV